MVGHVWKIDMPRACSQIDQARWGVDEQLECICQRIRGCRYCVLTQSNGEMTDESDCNLTYDPEPPNDMSVEVRALGKTVALFYPTHVNFNSTAFGLPMASGLGQRL